MRPTIVWTEDEEPTQVTCPYCHTRPLHAAPGLAATCGDPSCRRDHHTALEAARYRRHRERINAKRAARRHAMQDGRVCSVCAEAFYVKRQAQHLCENPRCRNIDRERRRTVAYTAPVYQEDLTDAQIEAKLASLAARRKATRSWLRIENPWQQRAGSELHKQTTVETYSLEGAML